MWVPSIQVASVVYESLFEVSLHITNPADPLFYNRGPAEAAEGTGGERRSEV